MIKASAPGSLIMFGEHSVLRGKHAIVLAIEKRLHITLEPTTTRTISINSSLGHHVTSLDRIVVQPPFQYVLQTLQNFRPSTGLNITITSDMPATMGFGTSAAVVVSLLGGLMALRGNDWTDQLFKNVLQIVQKVQGMGSGADVMASIKGGVSLYRAHPTFYRSLPVEADLFAAYSGSKTPTAEVVKHVAGRFSAFPDLLKSLDDANDELTLQAAKCLTNGKVLGDLFNTGAGLMEAFGVHTPGLSKFLWGLREQSYGVKLSGSGLGDCAIGAVKNQICPEDSFPIVVSEQGLTVEIA